jgi:long-chain acyl-CoA synthetase
MANSIVGLFQETVAAQGGRPAARFRQGDGWQSRTWAEMSEDRRLVAAGLLELGLEAGERVNILSNTSYRWMLADLGAQTAGAEPVAIYQSNLPDEVQYIVEDSGAVIVFAEDRAQLSKLLQVRARIPKVRKVIVMNDDADPDDWILRWSELVARGREHLGAHEAELERRVAAVGPETVLTLIYTSGTTGRPKGVVLTHGNMLYEAEAMRTLGILRPDDVQLLFLPMAHSFAKVLQCGWLGIGHEMAIDPDIQQIVPNMGVVRPTIMASVPRIFEKVYAKVTSGGLSAPGLKGKMFAWALRLLDAHTRHVESGTPIPMGLQVQLNIVRSLVFSKVRARLNELFGGRLRYFVSGGAPLSKKMAIFFAEAGVMILEGYGLTETSAATCVNLPDKLKLGTVGLPMPGTEVKIAADGEILIKGRGVMRGYWNQPEATAEVLSPDGWFASGDIGEIDRDGFVRITDRKKDIIVTAGGKNVAPQNIESAIKAASPLVSQVMVYGDKRKFLSALVTLEAERLGELCAAQGVDGDYAAQTRSAPARAAVQAVLDGVNAQLPSYETIKKFEILERDFEIGDELTPTLKVKRKHATKKYWDRLDALYDERVVE